MTNEEAKVFLDNLKICIDEHPVVADWLVEISNRKIEQNCFVFPNNCETCNRKNCRECFECSHYEPRECYLRKSCDHYGDKQVCRRCREYNLYSHTKTEQQTDCGWKKGEE